MTTRLKSEEEEKEFQAYAEALLTTGSDADVLKALGDLEVPSPFRVRVKVVYSPSSPSDIFSGLAEAGRLERPSLGASSFVLSEIVGRKVQRRVRIAFFVAPFDPKKVSNKLRAVVAVCKYDEWPVLTRLVRNQYPRLVPILLSQAELIRGARELKNVTGHELHVRAISAKEPLGGVSGERHKSKSVREWTDEELEEVVVTVRERQQILTSLDLDFFPCIGGRRHVRPRASCKIRKLGEIEVSGSFHLAFEAVATQLAVTGEMKLKFLSGRGMRESSYLPRPLSINFKRPVFESTAIVSEFIRTLARYPRSMYAVEHGNPHAHLKLTDLYDGSSFDVWAIPPARIALIPGLKASEAAFERVVHYIFEQFKEGDLENYGRAR